ncbi:LIM domain-containing protein C4F6.12 isoform X2 [Drosophila obscura]|uniref:LIM domain-containing protein C4F6.12 isoform X2 n=1 Tax=Drosophila obscura TaxID=7282 RepID=UPI001BB11AE9|nr:LIM domain-containing protein C4F6.12 isoform X2 [Drosophila obscura]
MESLEQQLMDLSVLNDKPLPPKGCTVRHGKVAELVGNLQKNLYTAQDDTLYKKMAPSVPPKPPKKQNEMPQPLLGSEKPFGASVLFRKNQNFDREVSGKASTSKSTLDNPAVLEQQLEALAYHKLQMEKKGLLGLQMQSTKSTTSIPKLSSNSLGNSIIYSNLKMPSDSTPQTENKPLTFGCPSSEPATLYSNINSADTNTNASVSSLRSLPRMISVCTNSLSEKEREEDMPPPPSPVSAVSSSYSELRRATNLFNKPMDLVENDLKLLPPPKSCINATNNCSSQYSMLHNAMIKSSSTYDSIYEPINPRPPGDLLSRASYNMYDTYVNDNNIGSRSCDSNSLTAIDLKKPLFVRGGALPECYDEQNTYQNKNSNDCGMGLCAGDPTHQTHEFENYGRCVKCNKRVLGESSGCTAMDQIYHISCFTCTDCQINLQGKPFYALEGKPYCEYDYLQTLEKCSVCMKPILERILRATGKPYHPQCFTCVVCGKSLDGLLFTVDATNQNYCITDFHKKFAPRCCVCKEPIMPELGQEETVRVVALDRSFHLECYKCEDCGLLLSSEADGRGCYPLDDHILCKSCNAQRVQALTNRMTTEH